MSRGAPAVVGYRPLKTSLLMRGRPRVSFRRIDDGGAHRADVEGGITSRDVGVYVHVPYCRATCLFCPYFRTVLRDRSEVERYLGLLLREVELYGKFLERLGLRVVELHAGGGTPSLVPPRFYRSLLEKLGEFFDVKTSVGLEANPEDLVNRDSVEALRSAGVDEVSIGVQSFDRKVLLSLGRKHPPEVNARAVENCVEAGFRWVNVDLMFLPPTVRGYAEFSPGEKLGLFRRDLEVSADSGVDQVTYYATIVPRGSPGYRLVELGRVYQEVDQLELFVETAVDVLSARGMRMTRVYSFSRRGYEYATVNLEMVGPLIGFGAGAWSNTGLYQYVNTHSMAEYAELLGRGVPPAVYARRIDPGARLWRILFDQLFTVGRMSKDAYRLANVSRFPASFTLLIRLLTLSGLVKDRGDHYALTKRGIVEAYKAMINYVVGIPVEATRRLVEVGASRFYPETLTI